MCIRDRNNTTASEAHTNRALVFRMILILWFFDGPESIRYEIYGVIPLARRDKVRRTASGAHPYSRTSCPCS